MFSYEFSKDMFLTIVDLKYHDKDNVLIEKQLKCLDVDSAATQVMHLMHEYMSRKFRNYVLHAYKLGLGSKHPKYVDQDRIKAIEELMSKVRRLQSTNLPLLAFYIRYMQKELELVLPAEGNNSYESSKSTLDELLRMANALKQESAKVL